MVVPRYIGRDSEGLDSDDGATNDGRGESFGRCITDGAMDAFLSTVGD